MCKIVGKPSWCLCALAVWRTLAIEPSDAGWKTYETAIGGSEHFVLNNDITVQLNTDTRLRTSVAGISSAVRIDRGEAFFQVGGSPLQVVVHNVSIRSINTSFSVRDYGNGNADIVPLHGLVHIGPVPGDWADHVVSAGQIAAVRDERVVVQNLGHSSIQRKLMWRYEMLEFVDETVDGAVSEFNRYNRTRVVIDDPAIGCRRIGGRFSLSDSDVFVATVSRIFDLHTATSQTSTGAVIHLGRIPREVTTNTSPCTSKNVYQKE